MKIKWLGHSCFVITSLDGTRIITDPYTPNSNLKYSPVSESADVVTISHGHSDHSNAGVVKGSPRIIKEPVSKTVKGIEIKGVSTAHDENKGQQRGKNIVFCMTVDGIRIAHLGDLGHTLDNEQIKAIGPVDVLITPVGGFYTIDGPTASRLADAIQPKIVLPMHYRSTACDFPITDAKPFLKGRSNIKTTDENEIELTKEGLPETTETVVLRPANC